MQLKEFLNTVVTCPEPGYFCLALRSVGSNSWLEEWHRWPQDADKIVSRALSVASTANVYFSSYLFRQPQSIRDNVLPTRTIQADLDEADLDTLPKEPTVLVETSPGRHQAYWVLDELLPAAEHETLSRKVTYSIPLCDRSGWPAGRKVRLPETFNHKYLTGPKPVRVKKHSGYTYKPSIFEALPEVPGFILEHFDQEFASKPTGSDTQALELLDRIKDRIPVKVYVEYDIRQQDRSAALWALLTWGFKAGLSRQEVFTLAQGSANNKFGDLRYHSDIALAKDILRAEHAVNSNQRDTKRAIQDLFKTDTPAKERSRMILQTVLQDMKEQGEFLHTGTGLDWYIRRDVGMPVSVLPRSDSLGTILDIQFGLNATEPETKFVAHGLRAYADSLKENATFAAMSHYDPTVKRLLIHTGRRDVLEITPTGINRVVDGAHGIVFPWNNTVEPFSPVLNERSAGIDWGIELFGNGTRGYGSSVHNVVNMTPEQATAVLKVWLLFVLLRDIARARPILATFGQPGSGKTTMFRKVFCVLYGPRKSLSGITTVDDFDHGAATDPLMVYDNVDTWSSWLPDRIALSAGVSDVIKRKLYTDSDTITMRRQAMLGITAHNPKFGREDVADRLLLISYRRLEHFESEELITSDILHKRDLIWGGIVRDLQKVLQTEVPVTDIPQFRIEDFARFGLWIARAIGEEAAFRSALGSVRTSQQSFSLDEEGMLVTALMEYVSRNGTIGGAQYKSAGQIWTALELLASDPKAFAMTYKNSVTLSKKLSSMQSALDRVIYIRQRSNEVTGAREWLICKKEGNDGGAG